MTERCSDKVDELLCSISYGHSQADSEIRSYIASLESSVAELTQRAESAEAMVREVAELKDENRRVCYTDRYSDPAYCMFCGSAFGCWSSCLYERCKRHAEEQR